MGWLSWVDLENEYRKTGKMLKEARERLEDNSIKGKVDKELLGGMIRDVEEVSKILKHKIFYELNSLSEGELGLLKGRQREIAELRKRYSYTEIAELLGMDSREVFGIFEQAVDKIKKAKRQQGEGIPVGFRGQQEKIYKLFWVENKTKKEIYNI